MARRAVHLRPSEARVLLDDAFLMTWNALARSREFRWSPELRAALHRNRAIQGICRGARCWIVGSRPSIGAVDLTKLAGEHTFLADPIALRKSASEAVMTALAPSYLVVPGAVSAEAANTLSAFGPDTWIFSDRDGYDCITKQASLSTHRRFVVVPNQRFVFGYDREIDLTRGIPGADDSAKAAVAIAVWMGFRRVNLLGVDGDGVLWNDDATRPLDSGTRARDQSELERALVRSSLGLRSWRSIVGYLERRGIALVSVGPPGVLTGLPSEPFAV